jgi:hypothetical protein
VTLSPVAFKAVSGFILLASTFDGRYSMSKLPSLEDWGRCGKWLCYNQFKSLALRVI